MITTVIQSETTQTSAPYAGSGVSVAGIIGDWTLVLQIGSLEPFSVARFTFEDSTDGFSSDILAGPSFSMVGPSSGQPTDRYTLKKADFPDLRVGVAGAELRLSLVRLEGAPGLSATFQAWLES